MSRETSFAEIFEKFESPFKLWKTNKNSDHIKAWWNGVELDEL